MSMVSAWLGKIYKQIKVVRSSFAEKDFRFGVKLLQDFQLKFRDGPFSSDERGRNGDGPSFGPGRRPRRRHGRAGLHLVLGPSQDVEARQSW